MLLGINLQISKGSPRLMILLTASKNLTWIIMMTRMKALIFLEVVLLVVVTTQPMTWTLIL
uniref:Uncharacterized protein n=1 Tax=Picea sitchensis TaxID=3332 RepID=A9NU52_PICSI|nr:unknown [Picea sitchensis]